MSVIYAAPNLQQGPGYYGSPVQSALFMTRYAQFDRRLAVPF